MKITIWIHYKLIIISCGPLAVTSLEQITGKKNYKFEKTNYLMRRRQKKVKNITKDKSFLIALTVSCIKCSNVQISLHCFLEPPCLHRLRKHLPALLIRGEAHVLPGVYTPSCDEDGFYLPRQCRAADRQGIKECWCVDRHGSKIEGVSDCGGYSEMCV